MFDYTVTLFIGRSITRRYDARAASRESAIYAAKQWAEQKYPNKPVQVYHVRYRPVHATH